MAAPAQVQQVVYAVRAHHENVRRTQRGMMGAMCGAVAGGLVLGPVGAVIGGVAGNSMARGSSASTAQPATFPSPQTGVSPVAVTIQMPAEANMWKDGKLLFAIDVYPQDGGAPWRVYKRYSSFFDLNTYLHQLFSWSPLTVVASRWLPYAPFPRKHFGGCHGANLIDRHQKLAQWLTAVLQNQRACPDWPLPLHAFLECWRYRPPMTGPQAASAQMPPQATPSTVPQSTPSTAAGMASIPQTRPPAHPAVQQQTVLPAAQPAVQPSQTQQMEVQIPQGVLPGQLLAVTTPDGRAATLAVPMGATAGSMLRLLFDPVAGTLSTMAPEPTEASDEEPAHDSPNAAQSSVLTVQIPPSVVAGQFISIVVPDGHQVNFAVPRTAVPGATMTLWYDALSATLTEVQ